MMHQSYNGIGRLSLSHAPTRLERNDTLSEELGVNIWIKYESELDAYSSGNKVRKLEYVLADVINTNSDTVVTAGGSNSNQCKAVAIYARRLGIKCELIVCDFEPMPEANGNYLIDLLMGAKVKKLPGSEWTNIEHHLDELVERLKVEGKKPYLLPPGSSDWRGSLGYIDMAKELAAQEAEIGTNFDHIVFPTGSGGMHTGLLAGTTMLNRPWNLTGICVLEDNSFFESKYLAILDDLEKYADIPSTVRSQSHFETHDGAVCGGYNQYDDQVVQAVVDAGRNHGLLIDPVYMGKAMLGLNQLIEEGKIVKDSNVILLHTGGTYILFGNEQQLSQNLRQPLTLGDI